MLWFMPESTESTGALITLLDRWARKRVVVVGDYMLDRQVYGDASRLSPDAPVPVLAVERETAAAGGAANVALDCVALGCAVSCVGVVGPDASAGRLRGALEAGGCEVDGLVVDPDRPTTVKHNFVGLAQHRHPQKMFRVDEESRQPVPEAVAERILAAAETALEAADVLCLEDYGKGVLAEPVCRGLVAAARRHGVEVLVDPAAIESFEKYRGASCLTPNRTELERVLGRRLPEAPEGIAPEAEALRERLELAALVVTLDRDGALLLEGGQPARLVPTEARAVYDVTGAGDMVLAMIAGARANGAAWPAAVALANVAAGLEIERFGVVPVARGEVLLALLRRHHEGVGKWRALADLLPELAAYRQEGKRVAFTNGCFDILHAGHVAFLRAARQAGDLLVVGLNSDMSIRRLKGQDRPVNTEADRVAVLSELESVDYILTFDADTPIELIEAIRPDVLVKGADYTREEVVGAEVVEASGGRVHLVELVEGRSTTNLIRKMRGGDPST